MLPDGPLRAGLVLPLVALLLAPTAPVAADPDDGHRIWEMRRDARRSPAGTWRVRLEEGERTVEGTSRIEETGDDAGLRLVVEAGDRALSLPVRRDDDRLAGALDHSPGIVGALEEEEAEGERRSVDLGIDPAGFEIAGAWTDGDASGRILLERETDELTRLLLRNRPPADEPVAMDGRTPFHLTVTERISPVLHEDLDTPVRLEPGPTRAALESIHWRYLAYKLEQAGVPGSGYFARRGVLEAVLDDHLASLDGEEVLVRELRPVSSILRNGIPFEGVPLLYSPIKDIYAIGAGQGVLLELDEAHRVRIVSTSPGNLASYMATLDHDLLATAYTKYLRDLLAIADMDELPFLDLCLEILAYSETGGFADLGPRARSVALDLVGVLAAEFHRVFGQTPDPVRHGGLIIPFGADMIEITFLSLFVRRGVEPIIGVDGPAEPPAEGEELDPADLEGPARLETRPDDPVSWWSPDGGLTMRRPDRRLLSRQIGAFLLRTDPEARRLRDMVDGRSRDLLRELARWFHGVSREDVASGHASEVVGVARGVLARGLARGPEIQAFVAERMERANELFAGRDLPHLGDYRNHSYRDHLDWLRDLDDAEREELVEAGFDRYLRDRLGRKSVKWEIENAHRWVLERVRALAPDLVKEPEGRVALAWVLGELAWSLPAEETGGETALREARTILGDPDHPKHGPTVRAALEMLDRLAGDRSAREAVGFAELASRHVYRTRGVSFEDDLPDTARLGRSRIIRAIYELRG